MRYYGHGFFFKKKSRTPDKSVGNLVKALKTRISVGVCVCVHGARLPTEHCS